MAMRAEAQPLLEALNATHHGRYLPLPAHAFAAARGGLAVRIVVNGVDPRYEADSIGTIPAALATHAALEEWRPDLVISAGTAGGWAHQGTEIGDVFVCWDRFVFHDHRVDLAGFAPMARGDLPAADLRGPAHALGLKTGIVTTGDSLDESADDKRRILASGAAVKDMEAAAVAWVAGLHGIPVSAVKAVTDLVDDDTPTAEQFLANVRVASDQLRDSLVGLVERLADVDG